MATMKFRVKIADKYIDSIAFESGIVLFVDTNFDHQEKVAYEAVITYVPEYIIHDDGKHVNGESIGVVVGDKVWVRYDVVGSSSLRKDGYRDHHNMLTVGDHIEWICGLESIFAVERNGEMEMMEGLALLKPKMVEADQPKKQSFEIVSEMPSPYMLAMIGKEPEIKLEQKTKTVDRQAVVVKMGKQKGRNVKNLKTGDTVMAELQYAQHYNFSGVFGDEVMVLDIRYIQMKIA